MVTYQTKYEPALNRELGPKLSNLQIKTTSQQKSSSMLKIDQSVDSTLIMDFLGAEGGDLPAKVSGLDFLAFRSSAIVLF